MNVFNWYSLGCFRCSKLILFVVNTELFLQDFYYNIHNYYYPYHTNHNTYQHLNI